MKNMSTTVRAIVYSLAIIILGSLSSLSVEWVRGVSIGDIYATFTLPPFSPPQWLFGPAWIFLYILLGIYCANLNKATKYQPQLYLVMYVQLALNILWTIAFFTIGNFLLASIMIVVMDILVIWLLLADTRKIRYILVPYLLWLLFATYLSISVTILN